MSGDVGNGLILVRQLCSRHLIYYFSQMRESISTVYRYLCFVWFIKLHLSLFIDPKKQIETILSGGVGNVMILVSQLSSRLLVYYFSQIREKDLKFIKYTCFFCFIKLPLSLFIDPKRQIGAIWSGGVSNVMIFVSQF